MSISGIQGQLLEVSVVGCFRLKDTEWISRQDPYVCLEYGSTKLRTRTCTDGGTDPVFQEKFVLNLIEGLREFNVLVWNSNTLSADVFIGSGKVQIQDALSRGYDDRSWSLQTKSRRFAGEIKLIMHYRNANTNSHSNANANQPPSVVMAPQPSIMYSAGPTRVPPVCVYQPPASSALPPSLPSYQQPQDYSLFSSISYNPPPHYPYPPQPYPPPSQPYPPMYDTNPPPAQPYLPPSHAYPPPTYDAYPPPAQPYPPPYPPPGYPQGPYPPLR